MAALQVGLPLQLAVIEDREDLWKGLPPQEVAEKERRVCALPRDQRLRATPEQLCDALGACTMLKPVYRRLLKMTLEHSSSRSVNWTKSWPLCSIRTRMRSSG